MTSRAEIPGDTPQGWSEDYFDEIFLRIYEPILAGEPTEEAIDGLLVLLGDTGVHRILDAACGWGRHAIPLADAGFSVTGVDLSEFLIDEARRRARAQGVDVDFLQADVHQLPFEGEFDVALSLFSSLGYGNDEADIRALRSIRKALRPNGILIMETMNRDSIARDFASHDWWSTPRGDIVRVEREFDPVCGLSRETLHWQGIDGSTAEKRHAIRIRTATEWDALLQAAGFRTIGWFGGWELEPLTLDAADLLAVAR